MIDKLSSVKRKMMSIAQNIQGVQCRTEGSYEILMDEKENELPPTSEENDDVLCDFSALDLEKFTEDYSFPIENSTEGTKEAQIKETLDIYQQLNDLKIIINQNREEYLSKKGDSEISLAFNNLNHKEDGKNKIREYDKSKINALSEKVSKYTNDFPDDTKEKIQQILKKIDRHAEEHQLTQNPRSSGNTTGETQTLNTSSKLVLVKGNGQPVHISAYECVIIIDNNDRPINVKMLDEAFKSDLKNLIKIRDGQIIEINEGSIKILVRFNSEKSLQKFEAEWKKGITKNEIYELLLKHKLIRKEENINVSVKLGNGALLNVSMEEWENLKEESIDLVPFMVAAYSCENLKQLDSRLASTLNKRITSAGFQSRYVDQTINTGDLKPSSKRLFPTLLHFAASFGLSETYQTLQNKPESRDALQKKNKYGKTPSEIACKTGIDSVQPYHAAFERNVLSDRYGREFWKDRHIPDRTYRRRLGTFDYGDRYEDERWDDTGSTWGQGLPIYRDINEEERWDDTGSTWGQGLPIYRDINEEVSHVPSWRRYDRARDRSSKSEHNSSRKGVLPTVKRNPVLLKERTPKEQHHRGRYEKEFWKDKDCTFGQNLAIQGYRDKYEEDKEPIPSLEQHIPKQPCLVETIVTVMQPTDVVISEDGNLLVAGLTNAIYKFRQSGEYVHQIILPSKVKVFKMCIMKKGDVVVISDDGNKCITLCEPDGLVIKSIGKGVLRNPYGIHVNEKLNVVYVADADEACVFIINMHSGLIIGKVGSKGHSEGELYGPLDVTVTNEGYLIVADCGNDRLQLFNNEGKFIKVLVGKGDEDGKVNYPIAVTIDKDNNILVTSDNKLQLFDNNGCLIKKIDQNTDILSTSLGLSIVSYNPRKVAVANHGGKNIKVFSY